MKRKIKMPRIPIQKPGHSWSKKDYNRKKEKQIPKEVVKCILLQKKKLWNWRESLDL